MQSPSAKNYRIEQVARNALIKQFGDVVQEGTLKGFLMKSFEVLLKWRQQYRANDEGKEQSRHPLTNELLVASSSEGEHSSGARNQEEQRYPPGVDQEQDGQDSVASFCVHDVPVY